MTVMIEFGNDLDVPYGCASVTLRTTPGAPSYPRRIAIVASDGQEIVGSEPDIRRLAFGLIGLTETDAETAARAGGVQGLGINMRTLAAGLDAETGADVVLCLSRLGMRDAPSARTMVRGILRRLVGRGVAAELAGEVYVRGPAWEAAQRYYGWPERRREW